MDRVYEEMERERLRTHYRVDHGELPRHMGQLTPSQRLSILVEEIGEIAEAVKRVEGHKPGLVWTEEETRARLEEELLQVGAIAADWLLCIDVTRRSL
jgi:NTP pyrophosphatase (non-canonical NTP hydrolase)